MMVALDYTIWKISACLLHWQPFTQKKCSLVPHRISRTLQTFGRGKNTPWSWKPVAPHLHSPRNFQTSYSPGPKTWGSWIHFHLAIRLQEESPNQKTVEDFATKRQSPRYRIRQDLPKEKLLQKITLLCRNRESYPSVTSLFGFWLPGKRNRIDLDWRWPEKINSTYPRKQQLHVSIYAWYSWLPRPIGQQIIPTEHRNSLPLRWWNNQLQTSNLLSSRAVDQEGRHHWQPWFHRRFRAQQTVHPFLGRAALATNCGKNLHKSPVGFFDVFERKNLMDATWNTFIPSIYSNLFWPQAQIEKYSWQNRPGFPNFSARWLPNIDFVPRLFPGLQGLGDTWQHVLEGLVGSTCDLAIRKIRTWQDRGKILPPWIPGSW